MFHWVVLIKTHHIRYLNAIYERVVKPLNRALEWEQLRNDFIRVEVEEGGCVKLMALIQRVMATLMASPRHGALLDLRVNESSVSLVWDVDRARRLLLPFHSLMLLDNNEQITAEIEPFTKVINYRRTLEDTRKKLGMSWDQIAGMAGHLVDMQVAKVIYPLTQDTVVALNPDVPMEDVLKHCNAHRNSYPNIDMVSAWSMLTQRPMRLSEWMNLIREDEGRMAGLYIIADWIKHGLAVFYTTYLRLRLDNTLIPRERSAEVMVLLQNQLPDTTHESQVFWKTYPYLFGEHSVDEIMWMEKLTRKDIQSMTDAFSEYLVTLRVLEDL
jgi:hypothetical protein